jgi:hypothetical protein
MRLRRETGDFQIEYVLGDSPTGCTIRKNLSPEELIGEIVKYKYPNTSEPCNAVVVKCNRDSNPASSTYGRYECQISAGPGFWYDPKTGEIALS